MRSVCAAGSGVRARAVATTWSRRAWCSALALAIVASVSRDVQAQTAATTGEGPSLVVLVRHAEKASATDPDPSLSAAGYARAKALVDALQHARPNAIVVTSRKRTAETAADVAAKFGITPVVVALEGTTAAGHIRAVADAVRAQRGVVLVVGHSNTTPHIVKALGGPALPDICDASYATLYLLQPGKNGAPATLVTGQYGAADPAGANSCAGMVPK